MKNNLIITPRVFIAGICLLLFIVLPVSPIKSELRIQELKTNVMIPSVSSLILNESIDLSDNSEIAAIASSGSGDPLDPYIIENLNFGLDSGYGIRITGTSVSIFIINCTFFPFEATSVSGIEITAISGGEITIQNCNFTNCITGVFLDNIVGEISIDQCFFYGISYPVTQFEDGYSLTITSCDFRENVYGINLNDCTAAEITDSNFTQTEFYAIDADDIFQLFIERNLIQDSLYGLNLMGESLVISENQIIDCFIGIRVDDSNIVSLSNNNLTNSFVYTFGSQQVGYIGNNQTISSDCFYGGQGLAHFEGVVNLTYINNRLISKNLFTDIQANFGIDDYLWMESNYFERVSVVLDVGNYLNCTDNEFVYRGILIDAYADSWLEVVDNFAGNTFDSYPLIFLHNLEIVTISGIYSQVFLYNCSNILIKDLMLPTIGGGIILAKSQHGFLRNITSYNTYSQLKLMDCFNITVIDWNLEGIPQSIPTGDFNLFAQSSDDLLITNSSFSDFRYGLAFTNCDNVTVEHNLVVNCSEIGISFYGSHNFSAIENRITNGDISIDSNSDGEIIDNFIDNGTLFLPWKENIKVITNNFFHGGIDVIFDESFPNYYADHILANKVNTRPILLAINATSSNYNLSEYGQAILLNCQDLNFSNFRLDDTYTGLTAKDCINVSVSSGSMEQITNGLIFNNCSLIELRDLTLTSRNKGIYGRLVSNFIIKNCSIQKGLRTIHLEGGNNIDISDSLLNASEIGLHVFSCSGNIHDNIIKNNSELGIYLTQCFDLRVDSNWITQSRNGIYILNSVNMTFAHNIIVLNEEEGLYIDGGDQFAFIVNFIFDNYDGTAPLQLTFTYSVAIMLNSNQLLGSEDYDNDGVSNEDEIYLYFTDPMQIDSDNDGFLDGFEIANGTDPLDSFDFPNLFLGNPSETSDSSTSTNINSSSNNSNETLNENFLGIPPQYYFLGSSGALISSIIILFVGRKRK
ncbi:right-handed parallel beta-helix repeat-containing protein [Candidatus Lokiarchaeum ossiferum]|uniref:right-handed parallel beta-helix repeat-containing protein n=1 Tax=Candidatus Lokiarchaeum ossiferum TaxID=2951803 RepID=UPI00352DDC21